MSETPKTWSVRVFKNQRTIIERAIKDHKTNKPEIENRRDIVTSIFQHYSEVSEILEPEVISPEQKETSLICEAQYLKRVPEPKTGILKWFCHRRVWKQGKIILAGDGLDLNSVKAFCDSCHQGYDEDEQKKRTYETVLAIKRFGESELTVQINSCVHPDLDFTQVLLGDKGELICILRNARVDIEEICNPEDCEFLQTLEGKINLKRTQPYKEFELALEHKTK